VGIWNLLDGLRQSSTSPSRVSVLPRGAPSMKMFLSSQALFFKASESLLYKASIALWVRQFLGDISRLYARAFLSGFAFALDP